MMMIEVPVAARILVAEDDVIVAEDIRETLEELGYEVPAVVNSGADAVRAARTHGPDLVLMDIRMPGGVDGIQAADRIAAEVDVPVVFLSSHSDDTTLTRAKSARPFGYLIKPFEARELKTAIEIAVYRHHAERLVAESRERYRRLFHDDVAGNYVTTPDGKILDCNRAFAELMGFESVDACLDADASDFYPGDEREEFLDELRERGEVRNRKTTLIRTDGSRVRIRENARGEFVDGRLTRIHGHAVDVTREERLQERLRVQSRMEAVGHLTAGIAHDFNNILTAIRGAMELARSDEGISAGTREDLEAGMRTCDRAANLVRQLIAVGGKEEGPRRRIELGSTVRDMTDLFGQLLGPDVELELELPEQPVPVLASRTRVEQVVLNLVVNARDALDRGGTIRVRVEEVEESSVPPVTETGESETAERRSGRWVRMRVTDDGHGMDERTRERAFDPFYSTKGLAHGSGLGLASVYGIVKEHGGRVDLESEPGEGTTVSVYLPRAEGSGPA